MTLSNIFQMIVLLLFITNSFCTNRIDFTHSFTQFSSEYNIDLSEIREFIDQGRQLGLEYLNNNESRSKKQSEDLLEKAEKLLTKEIKKGDDCRLCFELLVETHFYQSYFKYSKDYDDCLDRAKEGLERFPESVTLYFYQGYAFYNSNQFAEASKALNFYLIMSSGNPNAEAEVSQLLTMAQDHFLNNWHKQKDYYKSQDSRLDYYDQQTYKFYTAFQVTPQWELQAGTEAFNQLKAEAPPLQDPEVQMYLEELVSKLINNTPGPYSKYQITVLNSPVINALTPPGHIIIYTGLLGFVDSESQLAGVLAHEMAHNFGHHAGTRFIKALRTQSIANALYASLSNEQLWIQTVVQLTGQIGVDLFSKAHSRESEKEADLYGAHIMFNAGYNPASLSEFFLKLYEYNPKQPAKFLSTHPPSPDRALYLTEYLESFPMNREMRIDSEAFQKIKAKFSLNDDSQNNSKRGALPPVIKNNRMP